MRIQELPGKAAYRIEELFPNEFLELNPDMQRVSVSLYRLLAEGKPVTRQRLACAAGLSDGELNAVLTEWPGVYYDDEERIIGYWGLALPEMDHRFECDGQLLYTWCAWDALFIPQILNKAAVVRSTCPVTGERIELRVTPQGVRDCRPSDAVVSFIAPGRDKIQEDVVSSFCHYVLFFSSAEAGSKWTAENEGTFIMTVEDAYDLGQQKNQVQYGALSAAGPLQS